MELLKNADIFSEREPGRVQALIVAEEAGLQAQTLISKKGELKAQMMKVVQSRLPPSWVSRFFILTSEQLFAQ